MALEWSEEERCTLEEGVRRFPLKSGRCAALARVVYRVAAARDPGSTRGLQVRPKDPRARWIELVAPERISWGTHTLVETRDHAVDAVAGVGGCPIGRYLESHWRYPEDLQMVAVLVEDIDPGIQDQEP